MNSTYPLSADFARLEIDQRLRDADCGRRRRLARRTGASTRRNPYFRARQEGR